jgi:hypothetical protein
MVLSALILGACFSRFLVAILRLQNLEIAADSGHTRFLGRWLAFLTSNCKTFVLLPQRRTTAREHEQRANAQALATKARMTKGLISPKRAIINVHV